ncbi:MAG: alpha/beta fold hydrolase [Betaproteobacteria bacterium]
MSGAATRLVRSALVAFFAAAGTPGGAATVAAPAPALALHTCRITGLDHDALCGVLQRPLDPARPDGRHIGLHVLVIPAIARQKQPDPVFFFAGGPGQSAIGLAGSIERFVSRLGARRDIVLIDQRGTGHSAPLQCDTPTPEEGLARALDRPRLVAALDACRARLEQLPWGDLRFYTTSIAMADADAVRAALGAERVDLMGISYGTRAALEYLRMYPDHVRRVVIDGVAPPDMTLPEAFDVDGRAALDALFRDCAAEKACAAAHPALARTWERLLAALPKTVDVAEPTSGKPLRLTLTSDAVKSLLRPALYTPAVGAMLPHAIEEAAAGRFGVLLALGAGPGGAPSDLSEGEHFSVVCAEDVPRLPPAAAGSAGLQGSQGLYRDACAHWPRGDVPAAFYTIPQSKVPVLLLSGGLDPVTPPRHADRVARALGAQARSVLVANNGHGTAALPCMRDALFHYIDAATDAEAQAVDMSCAAKMPRPLAFQPLQEPRARPATNDPDRFDDPSPATPSPAPAPATKDTR